MTPDRLQNIIASYGAEPLRWPADERAIASTLVESDAAARNALDTARDIDAALLADNVPALAALSAARITRAVLTATHNDATAAKTSSLALHAARKRWHAGATRPALAAAAGLLLGFSLGFSGYVTSANTNEDDDTLAMEVGMAAFTTTSVASAWLGSSESATRGSATPDSSTPGAGRTR